MIETILIDDEIHCLKTLSLLLEEYCPEVHILDKCTDAETGLQAIEKYKPSLIFLDIEMPYMNGFEMLEHFSTVPFAVIFTTAYDQYAIKALHFSALDYLLKPIDREELQRAVQKVFLQSAHPLPQQIEVLLQKLNHPSVKINRIAIPTMEGLQMIYIDSIISCRADSNYTILHLKNKQKIIASRTLKEIEEMLEEYSFARVHHSSLINLNEVEKYIKGEGGYILMSDGTTVDVSRSRKEMLLKKLQPGKE
jgi:two-component system, LytTR family, response regulator